MLFSFADVVTVDVDTIKAIGGVLAVIVAAVGAVATRAFLAGRAAARDSERKRNESDGPPTVVPSSPQASRPVLRPPENLFREDFWDGFDERITALQIGLLTEQAFDTYKESNDARLHTLERDVKKVVATVNRIAGKIGVAD